MGGPGLGSSYLRRFRRKRIRLQSIASAGAAFAKVPSPQVLEPQSIRRPAGQARDEAGEGERTKEPVLANGTAGREREGAGSDPWRPGPWKLLIAFCPEAPPRFGLRALEAAPAGSRETSIQTAGGRATKAQPTLLAPAGPSSLTITQASAPWIREPPPARGIALDRNLCHAPGSFPSPRLAR